MVELGERYTGARVKRVEDTRILTGSGEYVDDVVIAGMVHAAFVRSPYAHARITSVDVSAARELPGVVAVITGEEMESLVVPGPVGMAAMMGGGDKPAYTLLATDKVRLVGDPIVMILAENRYVAEDAAELVEVDYDELPAVPSFDVALDPSSAKIFEDLDGNTVPASVPPTDYGDVDGAFARADRVISARFDVHRHQNVPMEGRAVAANFDPATGKLRVHAATQGVGMVRNVMATKLGLDPADVRVTSAEIGGSFGLKFGTSREEIAVAAASKHLGRPVKWTEDRSENLSVSGQAREERLDVEAAVTNEGDLLGLRVHMMIDSGAYPGMGAMVSGTVQAMMPGPYKIEGLGFQTTVAVTNKATYVAYRGPWASETFARERMINLIAAELGKDPLEIRRRNVVVDGEPPLTMVTGRSHRGVTARQSIERIVELVDIDDFRQRQTAARAEGRYLGLGMATYIEAAPGPRGEGPLGRETMRARLEPDGTVLVFTGQTPHGQGHQTTFAQIAADQLGVPFEQVRVVFGDTDIVPNGFTGGSRAATMAGGASLTVARDLKARILALGADLLEASVDDLQLVDGSVAVRGVPSSAMTLAQLAAAVAEPGRLPDGTDTSLAVESVYDGGQGGWSGGTHCAEVEIDIETGMVEIRRYVVAEDCGELINPAVVEGQVRGGVAQGIGAVLLERSAYDENGQFLSGSFMDYLLPSTTEVPTIEIDHLETVPLDADVNFRGVGEGGMIVAPPTICNAIEDALAPFGVKIYEQHLPPNRILELIGAIQPE
jgi:carbon-monoxide dehydrogenase large subunit